MGGGHYRDDVGSTARSTPQTYFQHTTAMAAARPAERKVHDTLNPKGKVRECLPSEDHPAPTPIAVAFDLTDSRGSDTEIVCAKLPSFVGQIMLNDYVQSPQICFVGIGDATCDRASLQVGQFESDSRLDGHLRNMWIEKGGGGTGQESYQNGAYFLARKTALECVARGKKGFAFFLGDEGFYPNVSAAEIKRIIGDELDGDMPSAEIFRELQEKYHTYFIYPRSSWEERKTQIDSEIAQRVAAAGGMIHGVDIRFSLAWHTRNDLDLHVQTPQGHHIYYGSKRAPCGGELDVDMNVRGETTKPVENVRWAKGVARRGHYEVWVENYAFHEGVSDPTDFKVEIEINGQVTYFEGRAPRGATHERSRVKVGTFFYDPSERPDEQNDKRYALYDDKVVKTQWASVIPPEHVLLIDDPKACVDVMLGVLALVNGTRTLDTYCDDLVIKGQTELRIKQVRATLEGLGSITNSVCVEEDSIPKASGKLPSRARGSRL